MVEMMFLISFIVLLCVSERHKTTAYKHDTNVIAGNDSSNTDMYGTRFVFPWPMCNPDTYFNLQLVPRGYDVVIVAIKSDLQPKDFDEIYTGSVHFGDLRNGNSTTLSLRCDPPQEDDKGIVQHGSVLVLATAEILLHVLYGIDSYSVIPQNALGTDYTLLSLSDNLSKLANPTYFFTVSSLNLDTNVTFTVKGKSPQEVVLGRLDQFVYKSKSSLTGTTIHSSDSIFVVSGCIQNDNMELTYMEHVLPYGTWGQNYVLLVPFDSANVDLHVAAYASTSIKVTVEAGWSGETQSLLANGSSLYLSEAVEGPKRLLLFSASKPFQLLVIMKTPYQEVSFQKSFFEITSKKTSYKYRLNSLVSVASVEQYVVDPCGYPQLNRLDIVALAAGFLYKGIESDQHKPFSKTNRLTMGKFWVRAFDGSLISNLGTDLGNSKPEKQLQYWFYEIAILKRNRRIYYIDGNAKVIQLYPLCQNKTTYQVDDSIDNDCDGLIDEELRNSEDDDGDDILDEDVASFTNYNCKDRSRKSYTWERNRYRLTRFEPTGYEVASRLPKPSREVFMISFFTGISLVFAFVFGVWMVDTVHQMLYPGSRPKIF